MTTVKDYESDLQAAFPQATVRKTGDRRYWLEVDKDVLPATVKALYDRFDITHLATIVGEDLRDCFLVNYILAGPVVITVGVKVDRENPEVPSLASTVAGALVYEREIHDLFGIVPVGHPDLTRQALPEDWPAGVFPLRKDVKMPGSSGQTIEEVK